MESSEDTAFERGWNAVTARFTKWDQSQPSIQKALDEVHTADSHYMQRCIRRQEIVTRRFTNDWKHKAEIFKDLAENRGKALWSTRGIGRLRESMETDAKYSLIRLRDRNERDLTHNCGLRDMPPPPIVLRAMEENLARDWEVHTTDVICTEIAVLETTFALDEPVDRYVSTSYASEVHVATETLIPTGKAVSEIESALDKGSKDRAGKAAELLAKIALALDARDRKHAVDLRRELEEVSVKELYSDALKSRHGTAGSMHQAYYAWLRCDRRERKWVDRLMRERLLRPV